MDKLKAFCVYGNNGQKERLDLVISLANDLIEKSDQSNARRLFEVAESLQNEIYPELNSYVERFDQNDLNDSEIEDYENLDKLSNELQVIINLHPERILDWREIRRVKKYIKAF